MIGSPRRQGSESTEQPFTMALRAGKFKDGRRLSEQREARNAPGPLSPPYLSVLDLVVIRSSFRVIRVIRGDPSSLPCLRATFLCGAACRGFQGAAAPCMGR